MAIRTYAKTVKEGQLWSVYKLDNGAWRFMRSCTTEKVARDLMEMLDRDMRQKYESLPSA